MLVLDQKVTLSARIPERTPPAQSFGFGSRVDVMLDGGGNLLVSLNMQKPGLYAGSQSGLEFVMRTS